MSLRHFLLPVVSAGLLLPLSHQAAPLVSIGDNADLFFNGSSSVRWNSNIFRDDANEEEDMIFTLSPGLELNFGRGVSNADLSVIAQYDITRYTDNDRLDSEQLTIRALGSYRSSRLDLRGSVGFSEQESTSGDEQVTSTEDLIKSENYDANLDGEYRFSPKFSFGAGFKYSERKYTTFEDRLADRETWTLPFDLFYELTPKVDLSAGYSYTHSDVEETFRPERVPLAAYTGGYDTESHFFNIGARGTLLPKLNGFFKVGYRVRETDDSDTGILDSLGNPVILGETDRNDNGILGLDANFSYSATPKLSASLNLSRDFGVGGQGESTEVTSGRLSAAYSISPHWSSSAFVGYTYREYTDGDREDDQYTAGLRLNYSLDEHWRFSGGYSYSENKSDDDPRDYVIHIFDLTATLRY